MNRVALPALAAVASIAMTASPAAIQKVDTSEKGLRSAAIRYVAEYEKQFAFLVADENYRQTLFDADNRPIRTRTLKAELFLTYLVADAEWIAVRDVSEVDGEPVKDRDDLRALLSRTKDVRLARELTWRNARYNIGLERNFNEPTLPLLLLDQKRADRVKFDRLSVARENETTLATLGFEERDRMTLVRLEDGDPVRARGEFVLDAATGAIRRTLFQLSQPGMSVRLETTYARDPKLDLWLPSVFTERYESGNVNGARFSHDAQRAANERVECEARYSNYRKFDVTARIK